jgi:hypothetical protein
MQSLYSSALFNNKKWWEGNQLPSPILIISPNTSNRNLDIVILFSIFERSSNYISVDDTSSPLPEKKDFRTWVMSFTSCPVLIYKFYGRGGRINFRGDLLNSKWEFLVPLLRVKSHQRVTSHPPCLFSPHTTDRNFWM